MEEKRSSFYGAYFNKSATLAISRWAGILAWVVLAVYLTFWMISFLQFIRQFSLGLMYEKGITTIDMFSIFTPYLTQPLPGIAYFFGLKFVEHTLQIFLDVEESVRRAARLEK